MASLPAAAAGAALASLPPGAAPGAAAGAFCAVAGTSAGAAPSAAAVLAFLNAGRRRDRSDRQVVIAADRRHIGRQLHIADMDALAHFEAGQIDDDIVRDEIRRAVKLDFVADDVENAALLDAGASFLVLEVHRHGDRDAGILAEPQEVDMGDEVAHRLELDVARNGPYRRAFDFEVDQRRQEAAGLDMRLELVIGERNQLGIFLVAIDDGRHATFAAHCAGGPLAALATRRGLEIHDLGHSTLLNVDRRGPSSRGDRRPRAGGLYRRCCCDATHCPRRQPVRVDLQAQGPRTCRESTRFMVRMDGEIDAFEAMGR